MLILIRIVEFSKDSIFLQQFYFAILLSVFFTVSSNYWLLVLEHHECSNGSCWYLLLVNLQVAVLMDEVQRNLTNSEFVTIRTTVFCALRPWRSHYHDQQDVVKEEYQRGTKTKISSFFKHGLNNTKYVGYLKCFSDWCENLHFYNLWQVNLFYDMQSKFQNKVVLPRKKREVHFIVSLNIFSEALI
jgi:hypothetical protein